MILRYMSCFLLCSVLFVPSLFGKMVGLFNASPFAMDVEVAACSSGTNDYAACGEIKKRRLDPRRFGALTVSGDFVSSIKATIPPLQEPIWQDGKISGLKITREAKSVMRNVSHLKQLNENPFFVILADRIYKFIQ